MRVQFNTGRLYTAIGQVIVAELRDDGRIYFYDTSRMIDGKTVPLHEDHVRGIKAAGPLALIRETMNVYDNGLYNGSWNDYPKYDAAAPVIDYKRG